MNFSVKIAYGAIILAILSFGGIFFGADRIAFTVFAAGCLIYSSIAYYIFRQHGVGSRSRAFLGSIIGMTIIQALHVILIIVTLVFRHSDTLRWGWQFILTFVGIVPAMFIGMISGGLITLYHDMKKT